MPLNEWYHENMYKWCHESRRNYTFINVKATKISKRCVFVLVTWPWRLLEEWSEACGSLTVVGAGTMHGFGTDPIRNPTIWLVGSRIQVNWFAYHGRMGYMEQDISLLLYTYGLLLDCFTCVRLYGHMCHLWLVKWYRWAAWLLSKCLGWTL